jgi:hypothetical protein
MSGEIASVVQMKAYIAGFMAAEPDANEVLDLLTRLWEPAPTEVFEEVASWFYQTYPRMAAATAALSRAQQLEREQLMEKAAAVIEASEAANAGTSWHEIPQEVREVLVAMTGGEENALNFYESLVETPDDDEEEEDEGISDEELLRHWKAYFTDVMATAPNAVGTLEQWGDLHRNLKASLFEELLRWFGEEYPDDVWLVEACTTRADLGEKLFAPYLETIREAEAEARKGTWWEDLPDGVRETLVYIAGDERTAHKTFDELCVRAGFASELEEG